MEHDIYAWKLRTNIYIYNDVGKLLRIELGVTPPGFMGSLTLRWWQDFWKIVRLLMLLYRESKALFGKCDKAG